jgi:hypothetical protein
MICFLLCGSAFAQRASAALDVINLGYHLQPTLETGNANKMLVGKLNHIHAVLTDVDTQAPATNILYEHYDPSPLVQNQPQSVWDEEYLTTDNKSSLPALAVDTDGKAVVVWVTKPTPQSVLGTINYRYQTSLNCSNCWSVVHSIAVAGTEPSVTAENGIVYVAWTSRDRVQFTSFPKTTPPASPLWLGDVVDSTNCPATKFHQPSIALVHPPCGNLNIKIAALLASNEQSSAGSCHSASTAVGPRVYERDNTTLSWSQVTFSSPEVVTSNAANQPDPVAVSISMNANRLTGEFYLAWADELNGMTRTRLGHGSGATWDFTALDTLAHHVHVAAKSNAVGKFRLAVNDPSWGMSGYTQTGKWSAGQLTWNGPATMIADSNYGLTANPQAVYWGRCAGSHLKEIKTFTAADDASWDGLNEIASDLTETSPVSCWQQIGDVLIFPNCFQSHISLAHMVLAGGGEAVVFDLGDSAAVSSLSETGAKLTAFGGGTIQITWAPGELLSSSENGFSVATSSSSVRFTSSDARYTVEDLGLIGAPGKK